jgi:hypothetical protein
MNKIYKYFTVDLPITVSYINWFSKNFPVHEFKGVNMVLYLFLEYCSTLGIVAKRKYLLVFLSTDLKKFVRQYNIRVEALTANFNYDEITAFEQAVQVISTATVDAYDSFCDVAVEEDDNFKVFLAEFMNTNLKDRIMTIFTEQFTKMNQGTDALTVAEDTRTSLSDVKQIYDIKKISDLDFLTGNKSEKSDTEEKARLISKTGLPAIDDDYGGIFSKALITFAGQPGSGKTRFLLFIFIYPALVQYKIGVRLDSLELAEYEIKNILVSIHIANLYKMKIPDRDINRDDLSAEQKKIVESARIDLFESNKYGRFRISTEYLIVENMFDDAINFFKTNRDVEIWAVDYVGRIKSNPVDKFSRKQTPQIIDESLVIGKDVAKKADICAIFVNQFNDDGNKAADMGKPIMVGHIQGGQAVQRHSDYDIAITATQDQFAAKLRMISTTKVRAADGFHFVPLQTDLAIARYTQINRIEERG